MTKTELRRIYLARQKALSAPERAEKSRRIARHFFESVNLSKASLLHCFIPIEKFNEVDTSIILDALRTNCREIRIAAPLVNFETSELESRICQVDTQYVENAWGVREPADCVAVDANEIDMVLVPGLAFDRSGHRVGYGKGFYDRFLKTCREDCVKIGLSHFEPVEEIDDLHAGDTALNGLVTPEGVFTAETRRRRAFEQD